MKKYGKIVRTIMDPNKFILRNNIYRVKTYNKYGKHSGEFIIDKEDIEKCKKYKWYINGYGYVVTHTKRPNRKYIALHNLIAGHQANKKTQVDHINNNKLDNRKCNLRISTISQNNANRPAFKNRRSEYRGVYWTTKGQKWTSSIRVNGKTKFLGCFDKPKEAARAYNAVALKCFGEFASLNEV